MTDEVPDEAVLRQQVDRRHLQEIIAGLSEGILLVDPVDGIVWANDRALELHGVSDIAELGATPEDYQRRYRLRYRNNHTLTANQYPLRRLLDGDTFEDVVVEVTTAESTGQDPGERRVHRLRGAALTDSRGRPESYVLVIEDLTERFTAEERFERTFAANPAPAIICRLSDLRYVKVNQGFLEMTGYTRESVIGRTAYEIDVLEGAPDRDAVIALLRDGRTIPQTETRLRTPDAGAKAVIVAGQPIEIGDEACMLFTFMDMDPRHRAEDALRHSEERFARSFRLTPVPTMLSLRKALRLIDVNDAFISVLGFTAEEVVGRAGAELPVWTSSESRRRFEREIERHGSFRNLEMPFQTKEAAVLDCLVSADTAVIHGEECVLTVVQDITERKRSEADLVAAIDAVMQDTSWFSRTVIEKLASLRHPNGPNAQSAELSQLTTRELEVLALMCQGMSNAEVVSTLGLTRNTVRNYVARIYEKADVHNRAAAVVWARQRGFTGDPSPTQPSKRTRRRRQR